MIPPRLLTDTITIQSMEDGTGDRYGTPVRESVLDTVVKARVEPVDSTELVGRETSVNLARAFFNDPGVAVRSRDQVVWQGDTFEIEGIPAVLKTPRGVHHVELTMRKVVG